MGAGDNNSPQAIGLVGPPAPRGFTLDAPNRTRRPAGPQILPLNEHRARPRSAHREGRVDVPFSAVPSMEISSN